MHRTNRGFWVLSRFEDVFQAALDTGTYSSAQGLTFERERDREAGAEADPGHDGPPAAFDVPAADQPGLHPEEGGRARAGRPGLRPGPGGRPRRSRERPTSSRPLAGPLPTLRGGHLSRCPRGGPGALRRMERRHRGRQRHRQHGPGCRGGGGRRCTATSPSSSSGGARHPGDDMLSDLVAAHIDGRPLQLDEILGYCFVMIAGGNDTASGLLAGSAVLLSEHPEQRRRLLADPGTAHRGRGGAAADDQSGTGSVAHDDPRRRAPRGPDPGGQQGASALRIRQSRRPRIRADCRPARRDPDRSAGCSPSATDPTTASAPPPPGSRPAWRSRSCWRSLPGFETDRSRGRLAPGPFVRRYQSLPVTAGPVRRGQS